MDRKELVKAAYDIFLRDGKARNRKDVEIWQALAETDDDSLMEFINEHSRVTT